MIGTSGNSLNASRINYAAIAADRAALSSYLQLLSAVTPAQYASWSKAHSTHFSQTPTTRSRSRNSDSLSEHQSSRDFGTVFGNP